MRTKTRLVSGGDLGAPPSWAAASGTRRGGSQQARRRRPPACWHTCAAPTRAPAISFITYTCCSVHGIHTCSLLRRFKHRAPSTHPHQRDVERPSMRLHDMSKASRCPPPAAAASLAAAHALAARSSIRWRTTFLPLIRLTRRRRSFARWQASLAWPCGSSRRSGGAGAQGSAAKPAAAGSRVLGQCTHCRR